MTRVFRSFIICVLLTTMGGLGLSVAYAQDGYYGWPIIADTEAGRVLAPTGLPKGLELTVTVRPKVVIESGSVADNFQRIVNEYMATLGTDASRNDLPAEIENGIYHSLIKFTHSQRGERLVYLLAHAADDGKNIQVIETQGPPDARLIAQYQTELRAIARRPTPAIRPKPDWLPGWNYLEYKSGVVFQLTGIENGPKSAFYNVSVYDPEPLNGLSFSQWFEQRVKERQHRFDRELESFQVEMYGPLWATTAMIERTEKHNLNVYFNAMQVNQDHARLIVFTATDADYYKHFYDRNHKIREFVIVAADVDYLSPVIAGHDAQGLAVAQTPRYGDVK